MVVEAPEELRYGLTILATYGDEESQAEAVHMVLILWYHFNAWHTIRTGYCTDQWL